jgi:hypothetical protein
MSQKARRGFDFIAQSGKRISGLLTRDPGGKFSSASDIAQQEREQEWRISTDGMKPPKLDKRLTDAIASDNLATLDGTQIAELKRYGLIRVLRDGTVKLTYGGLALRRALRSGDQAKIAQALTNAEKYVSVLGLRNEHRNSTRLEGAKLGRKKFAEVQRQNVEADRKKREEAAKLMVELGITIQEAMGLINIASGAKPKDSALQLLIRSGLITRTQGNKFRIIANGLDLVNAAMRGDRQQARKLWPEVKKRAEKIAERNKPKPEKK